MTDRKKGGPSVTIGSTTTRRMTQERPLSGEEATVLAILAKAQWLTPEMQEKLVGDLDGFAAEVARFILAFSHDKQKETPIRYSTREAHSEVAAKYFIEWAMPNQLDTRHAKGAAV